MKNIRWFFDGNEVGSLREASFSPDDIIKDNAPPLKLVKDSKPATVNAIEHQGHWELPFYFSDGNLVPHRYHRELEVWQGNHKSSKELAKKAELKP